MDQQSDISVRLVFTDVRVHPWDVSAVPLNHSGLADLWLPPVHTAPRLILTPFVHFLMLGKSTVVNKYRLKTKNQSINDIF